MKHLYANRVHVKTGEAIKVSFIDADANLFHERSTVDGFTTETALLIVNRWNYISQMQPRGIEYMYYLSTVDGAQ